MIKVHEVDISNAIFYEQQHWFYFRQYMMQLISKIFQFVINWHYTETFYEVNDF